MRRALHDFGLWVCLLARANQGRQGRLYVLEPDHPRSWRRQPFTGRCASAWRLTASGCCQSSNGNSSGYASQRLREDGRSPRDHARTGEACRPSSAVVPNAAHATGDPIGHGACAWAFFSGKPGTTSCGLTACLSCASTFAFLKRSFPHPAAGSCSAPTAVIAGASGSASASGCRSACSGPARPKFTVNTTAGIQPGAAWAFVPHPAASAAYTSFGRRRRRSHPSNRFCRFSSRIGDCRAGCAFSSFAT